MFEALVERSREDPNIARLGRSCDAEFVLQADETPWHVIVRGGVVDAVREGPFKMRAAGFRIAASSDAWREFMAPRPKPGHHDIFAMSATGVATVDGDVNALLDRLAYYKALIALLRTEA